jgi:tRNA(fMet)-specific endonuclease VapC
MFLLDTDTLTLLFAGHPRVIQQRKVVPSSEIAIAIVTRIEVLRGRFDFLLKAANRDELLRAQTLLDMTLFMLESIETTIPVDPAIAGEFDRLMRNKKLKKIGRADMLIASVALARRIPLVTRNMKHFQHVPGLNVLNWAD